MPETTTLPGLVADLVASRHAGGYRFKVPERVLRQFVEHCRRQGYPDGSITQEVVHGFLYGTHLRSSTIRRNELALRQLAEHAQAFGWQAYTPTTTARVRVVHQVPYVLTDDEIRRLFAAIDSQTLAGKPAGAIFGTTGAAERADRVDPVQHVALLTGRRVRLYCGDGSRPGQSPDPLETTLLAGNRVFQDAAVAAGVDCTLTVLPGGHDFGTWLPALAKDLPGLLRALGPPE